MAYEFDLETLNDNLDPFGINCPERDVFVEKLGGLCSTYRKTIDDISDELVSVMNNQGKKTVDLNILATLEENLEAKAQKIVNTPRSVKKPARVPLAERSGFVLSAAPGDDEKPHQSTLTSSTVAQLEGHFLEFSPYPNSPANEKFLKRVDPGKVISTIRGKKFQDKGLKAPAKFDVKVRVTSKQPSLFYGGDKSSVVIGAKSKRMKDLAQHIQTVFSEISDWGNPLVPSVDFVYTYGQVVHDESKDSEKFGENSVVLMINDEDGTMIRLNLSKVVDDVTLFPGQIIAVRGINESGNELQVDRVFTSPALPLSTIETDSTKDIWFASGPYTAMDNCGYEHLCELLDRVVDEKPDILVLAGPFLDKSNSFVKKTCFTTTYDDLFEDLMMKIKDKLKDTKTEIIIQPNSARDLCIPSIFPCPPLHLNRKKDTIKKDLLFVSDPCIFRIGQGGVEIALTSSEPIQGLSTTEFHRSSNQENSDRIVRLSSHLLTQQSLYPLEPTEIPSSMGGILEVCSLNSSPHIVFAPSKLVASAKNVNNSLFINSSSLAKGPTGNYVKMSINLHAGELGPDEQVSDYCNIQIMRI